MNFRWIAKLLEPQQEITGKKHWLVRGAVLLIWLVCLGLVFWGGWKNRNTIIPYLLRANFYRFIGVFFAYLGSLVAAAISWSTIMHNLDRSISWLKNVQIYCITLAARRLPGTIWYVGGRMVMYQQLGVAKKTVLVASSIEIVTTLVTGGLVGLVLVLVSGASLPSQVILVIIVGAILGTLILHPSTLKVILKKNGRDLVENLRLQDVLVWFVLNTLMWVLSGFMLGQMVSAFQTVSSHSLTLIIGIWALAGTAGFLTFFLPSTFGVTEITIAILLSQLMPLPLAGTIAILIRLTTILFEALLSAAFYPFLIHLPLLKRVDQPNEEKNG